MLNRIFSLTLGVFIVFVTASCASAAPDAAESEWVPYACHHHSAQADEACLKQTGRGRSAWCEVTTSPLQKEQFYELGCTRPFFRQTSNPFSTVYCC